VPSDEYEETVGRAIDSESDGNAVFRKRRRVLAVSSSDFESDEHDVNIFSVECIDAEDNFKGIDAERNQMQNSQKNSDTMNLSWKPQTPGSCHMKFKWRKNQQPQIHLLAGLLALIIFRG
jgi:hypothetical protein